MAKVQFIITLTKGDANVKHVSSFGRSSRGEFMTCADSKLAAYKFDTWKEAHSVKRSFIDKVMSRDEIPGSALVCEYVPGSLSNIKNILDNE